MLFNSWLFVWFFLAVYGGYLLLARFRRAQNLLLLVASYCFYGWWDWRFLGLLALSTLIDYSVGLGLGRTARPGWRKALLICSLLSNLGILGFFKYFDFFTTSMVDLLNTMGMRADPVTLRVILPMGVSFYTFQTLSYTIDVYRRQLDPVRSLLDFSVYVSFFPQLVAGPIERASRFLPQIAGARQITAAQVDAGLFLILWGYFKKVVVADNLALLVDPVYNGGGELGGLSIAGATLAFAFQIYGDFSGYSDIARGLSKLMGFDLMVNFKLPYCAVSPSDFWRRWHISLSTWLRDYLYIPLGGSYGSRPRTLLNLMATMLLGGLWHGASWTFVLWGAFHGGILILYRLRAPDIEYQPLWAGATRSLRTLGLMAVMFTLTLVGWLLFRAQTFDNLLALVVAMARAPMGGDFDLARAGMLILPILLMDLIQYWQHDLLAITRWSAPLRLACYVMLFWGIVLYGRQDASEFIYFQF